MPSLSWADSSPKTSPRMSQNHQKRSKPSQARQLLSCTTCRNRKVKCDRLQPCSACCARGHPKECEFIVGEGNDYSYIPQSYEIRKLRLENQRLKKQLQGLQDSHSDEDGNVDFTADRNGTRNGRKQTTASQRAFKAEQRTDNLYFGTPGLTNVVCDFANLQAGTHSLTHTVPRGREFYAPESSAYPFPAISNHSKSAALLELLPPADELFEYLDLFQKHVQFCSFPFIPEEMTRSEVERFLGDAECNAQKAPDMLALLFATLATGLQMGQYDRSGGQWDQAASEHARLRGDAFLAASMQSLRNASFTNTPTLLGIQTLVMMGPYLTNTGRFLDAWTLFGSTVRLAHSIGLHRNPKFLDPVPPLPQCAVRQALWWWMVHTDQDFSVTLGRPLGISGIGDCPPPQQLTTNPSMLRLAEFSNQFTILSRQILSSDGMMSIAKIDEFTDKLLGLWDTMPNALAFNELWVNAETPLPEWPLEATSTSLFVKAQSLLILLNRQRIEQTQTQSNSPTNTSIAGSPTHLMPAFDPRRRSFQLPSSPESFDMRLHAAPVRGRCLVINSCVQILKAFMFFKHRNPAALICWSLGQQAFNACMILLLDAWEMNDDQNEWLVAQAFAVFRELELNNVHTLAELAVARISEGLLKIGLRREEREKQDLLAENSDQHHISPPLSYDAAALSIENWSVETVMSNTGMFLLEDPGLQSFAPPSFQPLSWNDVSPDGLGCVFKPATSEIPSPTLPVDQVASVPFPMAATSPFIPLPPPDQLGATLPLTHPPFVLAPQPQSPHKPRSPFPQYQHYQLPPSHQHPAFTPINLNVSHGTPGSRRQSKLKSRMTT